MKVIFKYLLVVLVIEIGQLKGQTSDESVLINDNSASGFLENDGVSVEKRFLYTGKEQRREAKENYEEKCERSLISQWRKKPR
jgi:hypothetical protein